MSFENIRIDREDYIATLTVSRPKKLNALNRETISELSSALSELENDASIRVIILIGEGDKAFVAGADIAEFADFSTSEGSDLSRDGHNKLFNKVEQLSKPVIACVNGFALGGGLELAMAAHIRIASEKARMGLPEVSLGVIPGYGGTQRLPQLIGRGRANELIFSAGMIDANKAKNWGLVNEVVPHEEALDACKTLAKTISKNSPRAISFAIEAVNSGFDADKDGLAEEIALFGKSFGTEDFKEGTQAFLQKKKPSFSGK